MIALKIKYETDKESLDLIRKVQRQYSSCLHFLYNRITENNKISQKDLRYYQSKLNNIDLIDAYIFNCACQEAKQIYLSNKESKVIFGGKRNFNQRIQHLISKEEFKLKALNPIYLIGEARQKSNRKMQITEDLNLVFKLNKNIHLDLKLINVKNRKQDLLKLYLAQQSKSLSITYKISNEYAFISFDENELYSKDFKVNSIENRVFAIDMNPNYVGWSVVDWKSSSEFNVIKSGVISIKKLNDIDKEFKGKHLRSSSKERAWLSNKRKYETLEISKKLIQIALHYKCQLFSIEDLNIQSSDKGIGKRYNKLVNNCWCRNALANNLKKRCNIFGIKLLEVKPEYSSFIGNFLFRSLNLPDMVLASIEIGRRAYEFYNQYITNKNIQRKNILQPSLDDFNGFYLKSLEEFGLESSQKDLVGLYYFFKKSKKKYRLSVDDFNLQFSRLFSIHSNINYIMI